MAQRPQPLASEFMTRSDLLQAIFQPHNRVSSRRHRSMPIENLLQGGMTMNHLAILGAAALGLSLVAGSSVAQEKTLDR